ncbi:hypothetical protein OIB37_19820 [Streptomyces sp. NBC_00820]|nr:hypothetical protein OIB37_19820 [Streptomyces sp. NBC_00820]
MRSMLARFAGVLAAAALVLGATAAAGSSAGGAHGHHVSADNQGPTVVRA